MVDWRQQHKQMMGRGVGHQLQIVRLVLVVRRDVQAHHLLEEVLCHPVVAKQRVPIDVVQLALVRVRAKGLLALQRGIHAEDSVQPFLHGVPGGISDGLCQLEVLKLPATPDRCTFANVSRVFGISFGHIFTDSCGVGGLCLQLLHQLHREGSTCALVPADGTGHEDQVRTEHLFDKRKGDGGGFIHHQHLRLGEERRVLRRNVLDCLAVLFEDVDAHHRFVELFVGRLVDLEVLFVSVPHLLQPLDHEEEEGRQVLRGGGGHKDVGKALLHGPGHGHSQSGGFAASSCGGHNARRPHGLLLLHDHRHQVHNDARLICSGCKLDERPDDLIVFQRVLRALELLFSLCLEAIVHRRVHGLNFGHVGSKRDDVELVIHRKKMGQITERQ
mmetsp:Transcript_19976/g.34322  ORF Transcript_19976/g.34322 Transcript_19976/m.34322 type:complete len:387 (+) Transcript_19976:2990-4150(+)